MTKNENVYNPYEILKVWDQMNQYKPLAMARGVVKESEGNLYLQTLYHKDFKLEQKYLTDRLKTISADEYFCGE